MPRRRTRIRQTRCRKQRTKNRSAQRRKTRKNMGGVPDLPKNTENKSDPPEQKEDEQKGDKQTGDEQTRDKPTIDINPIVEKDYFYINNYKKN